MKELTKRWEAPGKDRLLPSRRKITALRCLLLLLAGVALAGVQFFGGAMPLAACIIVAMPLGVETIAAAGGAIMGYLLRTGGVECVENLALVVLLLAAVAVFHGTKLPGLEWFWPLMSGAVCGVLGIVSLLGRGDGLLLWLLRCLLAGTGAIVVRKAVGGSATAQLLLSVALVGGLSSVGGSVNPGVFCAFALCAASQELLPCALLGLGLDLCGGWGGAMTASITLAATVCSFWRQGIHLRGGCFVVFPGLLLAFFGVADAGLIFSLSAGVLVGAVVRQHWRRPFPVTAEAVDMAAARLENAADILDLLRRQLPGREGERVREAESVYDGAAEHVCRCCARYHHCWEHRMEETLAALNGAARTIIRRGVAERENFPQSFREQCCHLEGFVTAVNQELEGMLFRRRYRMELRESRAVLAEEFSCVASFLRAAAEKKTTGKCAYRPLVGSCSMGKGGSSVCGDRGVCFPGKHRDYYVILCDGMGTGEEASRCSGETVFLLQQLLTTGVEPEAALRILNGLELLRAADRFTTVDVLHLDLTTARSVLYKWGSAPSYWRAAEKMKKIGTASPPPGVGVGGDYVPERYELSLKGGEMLVLASDGATEAERIIGDYCGSSVHELAALLVSGLPAEDDMSAVVVSLKPVREPPDR